MNKYPEFVILFMYQYIEYNVVWSVCFYLDVRCEFGSWYSMLWAAVL